MGIAGERALCLREQLGGNTASEKQKAFGEESPGREALNTTVRSLVFYENEEANHSMTCCVVCLFVCNHCVKFSSTGQK